jgi:proteic killer suppression protein
LDAASNPVEMNQPGWDFHALSGALKGHWAISVNGNWRITFRFTGEDAEVVDYCDYH